jgi:hypothetical protein
MPAITVTIFFLRKDSELVYFNDEEGLLQELECTYSLE